MNEPMIPIETFRRQTILASACIAGHLKSGDSAIDATAGTGADSLMMLKTVGETGRVYAFDIQKTAADRTKKLIETAGLSGNFRFYLCSHDRMDQIPEILSDRKIKGVMFNLGYLPGGDHQIITKAETTLSALNQALNLMAEDGLMTICAYRHPEGESEWQAVDRFCAGLGKGIDVHRIETLNHEKSPVLYLVYKRGH